MRCRRCVKYSISDRSPRPVCFPQTSYKLITNPDGTPRVIRLTDDTTYASGLFSSADEPDTVTETESGYDEARCRLIEHFSFVKRSKSLLWMQTVAAAREAAAKQNM